VDDDTCSDERAGRGRLGDYRVVATAACRPTEAGTLSTAADGHSYVPRQATWAGRLDDLTWTCSSLQLAAWGWMMLQAGRPGATGTDSYQDRILKEATRVLAVSQGATVDWCWRAVRREVWATARFSSLGDCTFF